MTSYSKGTNNELVIKIRRLADAGEACTIEVVWMNTYYIVEAIVHSITRPIISATMP